MAPAFHVGQQGGGHQQGGLGLWIVLRHKIGHGTVQAAQPALL